MEHILFRNFLANRSQYGRVRARWQRYFTTLSKAQELTLQPYLNDSDDYDGNPIYSAVVPRLRRAVRIIQGDPSEAVGAPPITAWLDTIELEPDEPPLTELVIYLFLSRPAEVKAHHWIEAWLVEELAPALMDERIGVVVGPLPA